MKLKVLKCIAPIAMLATLAVPALAQTPPPYPRHIETPPAYSHNIGRRFGNQRDRIHAGVENGSLTRHEQYRLNEREAHIHFQEDRDRLSGGRFTPREHRHTQRELNRTSADIYRQKHDGQYR